MKMRMMMVITDDKDDNDDENEDDDDDDESGHYNNDDDAVGASIGTRMTILMTMTMTSLEQSAHPKRDGPTSERTQCQSTRGFLAVDQ